MHRLPCITAGQCAVIRSSSCRWLDGDPRDGRETLDGYEQGGQGPGQQSFAELLASTRRSVIRLEMPRCCPRGGRPRCDDPPGPGGIGAATGVPAVGGRLHRRQHPSRRGHPLAAPHQGGRPAAARRGLLGVRPPGGAVDFQRGDGTNRATTPSAQIPAPSATSRRRSRGHGTGRHRTRRTRPIRKRPAPPPGGIRSPAAPRTRGAARPGPRLAGLVWLSRPARKHRNGKSLTGRVK